MKKTILFPALILNLVALPGAFAASNEGGPLRFAKTSIIVQKETTSITADGKRETTTAEICNIKGEVGVFSEKMGQVPGRGESECEIDFVQGKYKVQIAPHVTLYTNARDTFDPSKAGPKKSYLSFVMVMSPGGRFVSSDYAYGWTDDLNQKTFGHNAARMVIYSSNAKVGLSSEDVTVSVRYED